MRPLTSPSSARITACVCAALALSLLGPATAGAAAGQNLFGSPEAPPAAAKPAGRAGKAVPGAAKVKVTPAAKVKTAGAPAAAAPTAPAPATTATTAAAETSSNTSTPMIMAVVALFAVLGGIAYYILRDARSVAPVVEGATGGTRNPEGRLRKRRAQAKAARRQRKRHRRR